MVSKNVSKALKKLFILTLIMVVLVGCGNVESDAPEEVATPAEDVATEDEASVEKKNVTVTTSFIYDMVTQLVGDDVELELIIPYGEDPHVYVAKPEDLNKVESADLLLYHGLHFEGQMEDVLEKHGKSISTTFDAEKIGTMEEDGEEIMDPHFWFDLSLYKEAVNNVAKELITLLPEKEDDIKKNLADYTDELDDLHEEIIEKLAEIPEESRYLITPHDAFNYFSRVYDIEVVAPQGVSTETEVSNADLENTATFITDHQVKAIFVETTNNPDQMKKLQEICESKGFEVKVVQGEDQELYADSLDSEGDAHTFIGMYRHNIDLIVENLK